MSDPRPMKPQELEKRINTTRKWLRKFSEAAARRKAAGPLPSADPLMHKAEVEALESQAADLRAELAQLEKLR